jgi:hypothetical protein
MDRYDHPRFRLSPVYDVNWRSRIGETGNEYAHASSSVRIRFQNPTIDNSRLDISYRRVSGLTVIVPAGNCQKSNEIATDAWGISPMTEDTPTFFMSSMESQIG